MPEGQNVELAHKLTEQEQQQRRKSRWEEIVEIVEVTFLAIVAIATAWSGYQAARWDGKQAFQYGQATKDRFQADSASTLGGQRLIANQSIFTAWLQAREGGDANLQPCSFAGSPRTMKRHFTCGFRRIRSPIRPRLPDRHTCRSTAIPCGSWPNA
jgi:hypothetical protein